jgi:hypothetical protein
MDSGKRTKKHNFCPTNPKTMDLVKKQAKDLFSRVCRAGGKNPVRVFHLWPDRGHETAWCSCPACRAFSPEEQNRIAANAAADALLETDPGAKLSYYENSEHGGISMRENTFAVNSYPDET